MNENPKTSQRNWESKQRINSTKTRIFFHIIKGACTVPQVLSKTPLIMLITSHYFCEIDTL